MASVDTYQKNRTEFLQRADKLPHTAALKPESFRRMDEIAAAIAAEQSITKDGIVHLPGDIILGGRSSPLCHDWVLWLMDNDPDGDYEYL